MKVVPPPLSGDYTPLSDHIDLDESQMSYGTKSSTSGDSNSVSNDFVSCDNSDKSSEVNTNDFASSDSSVKSSEPKSNDSTSCHSEAEIESNVGTLSKNPLLFRIYLVSLVIVLIRMKTLLGLLVIRMVPSYPSNNIPRAETKDTSNGVLFDTAEDIFQQELARLKDQEQRATSDAERLALGFANAAEELQKRASAKIVPTGSIPVPSGDTMVSPSDVSVPTGSVPVPFGSPTDSFCDAEP
ncbi:hypothetical protein Tco_0100155, partial [Tanacetum coccineum]